MPRIAVVKSIVVAVGCLLISPSVWAQQSSGIAGLVRDSSGAVLPGVTVEAASPALIEQVRTVITDGEGRYNIIDLRPGTYTVVFTLPGFSALSYEGIVITAGFTATVNADMQLGSLEETVTVTGASPLVDTQNVRQQTVVSREILSTLPTSAKHWSTLVALTPGFGGNADATGVYQSPGEFHGKGGTKIQVDGMGIQHAGGSGPVGYAPNMALVEEVTLQTSGISAEANASGAVMNLIPKEGGNTFDGSVSGMYANDRLQSDNLNDALRGRGLSGVNKILKIYDATATLGGPVLRNRLWFFGVLRQWGNGIQNADVYWNKTQGSPLYTPDLSRPADRYQWYASKAIRVTWQASQRSKLNFLVDHQDICICRSSQLNTAPEAMFSYHMRPSALYQLTWSAPLTNRLLLDAGAGMTDFAYPNFRAPGVGPDDVSILEQSTGFRYNARQSYNDIQSNDKFNQRFSVSYVTGTHAMKVGFQIDEGISDTRTVSHAGNVNYNFRNGIPTTIVQYATPYRQKNISRADLGIFAQDQWAIKRLTLTYGFRFEYFNAYVPAQDLAATPSGWVPARSFGEVEGVPLWKDLSPRVGAAYDLFGNGRTALKVSMGRYVGKTGTDIASANNPVQTAVNTVSRAWTDVDRDYVPDCELASPTANGECGAMSNQNFGSPNVTTRWSDDVLRGFAIRDFNWDMSSEVQHQLGSGISLTAGYYRSWYGNFRVTDNLLVAPGDYSPYCITAPTDARLPEGGGYQVCGLYDVTPNKFGQVNSLVTQASHYGKRRQVNDFIAFGINTRFTSGMRIGGGVDTGRTVNDTCFVVDSPQELLNCRVVTPFRGRTQVKLNGSYPLPYAFVASGVFQSVPGPEITADYAASNAEIAPSLGRNLAACGTRTTCTSTASVPLIEPGTLYDERMNRLDLRLSKTVSINQRASLQANVDLYNVFNAGTPLAVTTAFGSRWLIPTQVMDGRIVQFSAQLTF